MANFDNEEIATKNEEADLQNEEYAEPLIVKNSELPERASFKVEALENSERNPDAEMELDISLAKMTAKTYASFKSNLIGEKTKKLAIKYNKNFKKLMGLLEDDKKRTKLSAQVAEYKLDFEKCVNLLNELNVKFKIQPDVVSAMINEVNVTDHRQVAHAIKVPKKIPAFLRTLSAFIVEVGAEIPVEANDDTEESDTANQKSLSDTLNFVFTEEELAIMSDLQKNIEAEIKANQERYDVIVKNDLQSGLINQLGIVPSELVGIVKSIMVNRDEEIQKSFVVQNNLTPSENEVKVAEEAIKTANEELINNLQDKFINNSEKELQVLIDAIIAKNLEEREQILEETKNKIATFKEKATIDSNLTSAILGIKNAAVDMNRIFHDYDNAATLQGFIEETIDLLNTYNEGITGHILPEYLGYGMEEPISEIDLDKEKKYNESLNQRRKDAEIAFTSQMASDIYIPRTSFISGVGTTGELNTEEDDENLIDADEPILISEESFIKTINYFFEENIISREEFKNIADYFRENPDSDTLPTNMVSKISETNDVEYTELLEDEVKILEVNDELKDEPLEITNIEIPDMELSNLELPELEISDMSLPDLVLPDIELSNTEVVDEEASEEETKDSDIQNAFISEYEITYTDNDEDKLITSDILKIILEEQINDERIQNNFISLQSMITKNKGTSVNTLDINIKDVGNYGQLIGSEEEKAKKLNSSLVDKIRMNASTLISLT